LPPRRTRPTLCGKKLLGHYAANGVPQEKADEILGGFYQAIAGKIGETYKRLK
jgi:hypothetical protein